LLFEVSEPAVQSRSRHCTLQENPSPFQPLYIQTDAFVCQPGGVSAGGTACATKTNPVFAVAGQAVPPAEPVDWRFFHGI
ncbi:MAG: hypothetical protein ABSB88_23975, partial [Bryobacteraceae bacterium]